MVIGTPHYMSPEQSGVEPVDARSDLHALACVVYEMLAGQPPFTGPTAMAIMARHMLDPVPRLRTVRPTVAPRVTAALERAFAKTPSDRFPSVAEWREAITRSVTMSDPASSSAPPIHKPPPVPATPLLGREPLLGSAAELLRAGTRVLTITGVGGTGETRVAIELFRRLHASYDGGAAFVSLASITAAADVMPTVATTLDIAEAHDRSPVDAVATIAHALSLIPCALP